jgi:hypothetical protein
VWVLLGCVVRRVLIITGVIFVVLNTLYLSMVNLGDEFPNFKADTTTGPIKFHDWIGDS